MPFGFWCCPCTPPVGTLCPDPCSVDPVTLAVTFSGFTDNGGSCTGCATLDGTYIIHQQIPIFPFIPGPVCAGSTGINNGDATDVINTACTGTWPNLRLVWRLFKSGSDTMLTVRWQSNDITIVAQWELNLGTAPVNCNLPGTYTLSLASSEPSFCNVPATCSVAI